MEYNIVYGGHSTVRIYSDKATKIIDNTYDGGSIKELAILNYLDHPRINKCTGWRWKKKRLEIDSPLYAETLDEYKDKFLVVSRVMMLDDLFIPLFDALLYMKGRKIMHLDIKPDNIFVDKVLYLADFSSAWIEGVPAHGLTSTRAYVPPEGRHADYSVDIYMFGFTILEFLLGEFELTWNSDGELDIQGFGRVLKKYDSKVLHLLPGMVHRDPAARPAIEQLCHNLGVAARPATEIVKPKMSILDQREPLHFISTIGAVISIQSSEEELAPIMALFLKDLQHVKSSIRMSVCLFLVQAIVGYKLCDQWLLCTYLNVQLSDIYQACEFVLKNKQITSRFIDHFIGI